MLFFNPIIISNKIQLNHSRLTLTSLGISVLLHAMFVTLALYLAQKRTPISPKEIPITVSLANYAPVLTIKYQNSAKSSAIPLPKKTPTAEVRPSFTSRVSPERLSHNLSPVRPTVAPSDLTPPKGELLHSFPLLVAANDSPHDTLFRSKSAELTKPIRTSDEINGATVGRIRAMIENALTYPPFAKKLHIEGTVTVSFILKPNGVVENIQVLTSSGSSLLDTKAINTVRQLSGEYPPLNQTACLKIPITFSLTSA
ncbi:MAG: TonB family protein [Sulfuricurvum sp.]